MASPLLPGSAWPFGRLRTAGRLSRPRPGQGPLPCVAGRPQPTPGRGCVFAPVGGLHSPCDLRSRTRGLLESGHPSVLSLPVCPWDAMLGRLEGAGDPGLTRRHCIGLSMAQGPQATVLSLPLSWAQGFEWQSEYLGHRWRLPQACSRFPPGLAPHQGSTVAFASEAVAQQPRPWLHRGGMAAPWRPGGRSPLADLPDAVRAVVLSFLMRRFHSAHTHFRVSWGLASLASSEAP